jgi:hypothetical protein
MRAAQPRINVSVPFFVCVAEALVEKVSSRLSSLRLYGQVTQSAHTTGSFRSR